ncbi:MAG TPA: shikimate kinase AroK [Chromatiales bacterium]|nr:shikimate kinase AroK [Chromatiales bacterium]
MRGAPPPGRHRERPAHGHRRGRGGASSTSPFDRSVLLKNQNLFLVGPMGAGKSSIGRQLARRLGRPFLDSDREIEERTGVDIATIFEYEGEEGFRKREAKVIDELSRQQGIVMATGGGAVLRRENRDRLSARGFVVYLQASVETQLARTARDTSRPLLQTEDRRSRLESLMDERDPLYREIADLVVDTDQGRVNHIADVILNRIHEI